MKLLSEVGVGDVLVQDLPYAAVLLDGPQQGQMCPQSFAHMPGPLPCTFGSEEVFATEQVIEYRQPFFNIISPKLL